MRTLLTIAFIGATANAAGAADFSEGKALANSQCARCHDADDWKGETAASLESLIKDISAGKVKHKQPIRLSDTDAANVALYWSRAGK